jgi:hypothetical protein
MKVRAFFFGVMSTLAVLALCAVLVIRTHAQGTQAYTIFGTVGPHTTACPIITAAQAPATCYPSDGVFFASGATSAGGVGWVQEFPAVPAPAGVASIAVCSAAGAPCGPPQTGAISLSIPTKAIATVGSPPVSSASNTATIGPPSVVVALQ